MTKRRAPNEIWDRDEAEVVRREEELAVGTTTREAGSLRVRKEVDTYPIEKSLERHSERIAGVEDRVPAAEGDSGEVETLPDGSISIPVFEEELVVTKRVVVRERVIIRKSTVIDEHRIETELRKERVEIEADPGVLADEHQEVTGEAAGHPTGVRSSQGGKEDG